MPEDIKKDCEKVQDDLREVLFTLYDSISTLAGGQETPLKPELDLLKETAQKLADKGVIAIGVRKPSIIDNYIAACNDGDGIKAHFYSRMIFNQVVNILQKNAKCTCEKGTSVE